MPGTYKTARCRRNEEHFCRKERKGDHSRIYFPTGSHTFPKTFPLASSRSRVFSRWHGARFVDSSVRNKRAREVERESSGSRRCGKLHFIKKFYFYSRRGARAAAAVRAARLIPVAGGLMELQRVLYARQHFRTRNSRNGRKAHKRVAGRPGGTGEGWKFRAPPRNVFA